MVYVCIVLLGLIVIMSACLIKSTNLNDDLVRKLSKKDNEYWSLVARDEKIAEILNKQKAHLESKLKKFTSANLYIDFRE